MVVLGACGCSGHYFFNGLVWDLTHMEERVLRKSACGE